MSPTEYRIGGGWGDAINWFIPEQFNVEHDSDTRLKVVGWKRRKPKIGDTLVGEFENSIRRFRFVAVKECGDPHDMFFADVKCFEVKPRPPTMQPPSLPSLPAKEGKP